MKVTGETITDAQIRELRGLLLHEAQSTATEASIAARHEDYNLRDLLVACDVALFDSHWIEADGRREKARARCAEAWNERFEAAPQKITAETITDEQIRALGPGSTRVWVYYQDSCVTLTGRLFTDGPDDGAITLDYYIFDALRSTAPDSCHRARTICAEAWNALERPPQKKIVKATAETITDAQIRRLYNATLDRTDDDALLRQVCRVALAELCIGMDRAPPTYLRYPTTSEIARAKRQLAEAWVDRYGDET